MKGPTDLSWVVLGSGTAVPTAGRGPTAHLLGHGEQHWLVDCGSGALTAAAAHVEPRTVAGVVLTHHHPDHALDLVALAFALKVPGPSRPPLEVWGGEGTAAWWRGLECAWGAWVQPSCGIRVHELSLDGPTASALAPGLTLRAAPANHRASALHLRFEAAGRAIVVSGDTGPSVALDTLATGADLLLCECAAPDRAPIRHHLTPSQVAAVAEAARPREIWLTHLYAQTDPQVAVETVRATGVACRRAEDGDRWEAPAP